MRAFNKGLPSLGVRGERKLGAYALTDAEGRYRISFNGKSFGTVNLRTRIRIARRAGTERNGSSHGAAQRTSLANRKSKRSS
jgi:hypothetical protein